MIICKDNLEFMKELQPESIDLIYCDILYGTGRKFTDYQDLKANRKVIEDFYLPRIKEMHRILKSTGSIYLQMDTRISHWIKCIMELLLIFRNEISWCYKSGGSSNSEWSKKHDVILFYTKSNKYTFHLQKEKSYMAEGSGKNPKQTYYEDENGASYTLVNMKDWWIDIGMMATSSKDRVSYHSQKPKELLKRIITTSSNEGDTVADLFMGSGTTAVVCKELNREFIGCDINPKAIQITNKRLAQTSLF